MKRRGGMRGRRDGGVRHAEGAESVTGSARESRQGDGSIVRFRTPLDQGAGVDPRGFEPRGRGSRRGWEEVGDERNLSRSRGRFDLGGPIRSSHTDANRS